MIKPTKEEFIKKSKQGNLIPVVKEILADCETPVSAYLKMADGEYSFLLESVEGNEKVGRYSFLGSEPKWIFSSKAQSVELIDFSGSKKYQVEGNPLEELKKLMQKYKIVSDKSLPRFLGGAVGYVGYGMVQQFDGIQQQKRDELNIPDCCFMLADSVIAFDHVDHRLKIIVNAFIDDKTSEEAYLDACRKIGEIEKKLLRDFKPCVLEWKESPASMENIKITSNMTKEEYTVIVEKAKEYIRAGDIFQVVPSQRFVINEAVDPVDLYRVLRSVNPSPYMFLLRFNDFYLIGTSPEILVRYEDGKVEVRPIAGTRPRGKNEEEDKEFEKSLLKDPKELAEHIMLVDLGRNDVGRVCRYGSVHMSELMVVEKYSHVMHIVSDVEGIIDDHKDAFDVLKAAFPAGTVTGAPKIRAMQIIEELEKDHRGAYAGAIGYFSFSGDLDSCITIRTILLKNKKAYIQAGGGIVVDSVPEKEYQETVNKAKGMLQAIAQVKQMSRKE